jgi:hypothetical protein
MSRTDPGPLPAVLIVEDDPQLGTTSTSVQGHGYPTTWCRTGSTALIHVTETEAEIVLLDLGLPASMVLILPAPYAGTTLRSCWSSSPPAATKSTSSSVSTPALMTTSSNLSASPCYSARLRAHLRRRPISTATETVLQLGALTIDLTSRRCQMNGYDLALRPKEFDLFAALAAHSAAAVSREQLMNEVWDENWYGPAKTVRRHNGCPPSTAQRRRPRSSHPRPCLADHHHPPRLRVPPRPAPIRAGANPSVTHTRTSARPGPSAPPQALPHDERTPGSTAIGADPPVVAKRGARSVVSTHPS